MRSALLLRRRVSPPIVPPALRSGATSGSTSGLTATITLPTGWQTTDYLTLIVSSNQAPTLTVTSGVDSYTVVANAASRLQTIRLVPTAGATTVTLTSSVSAVLTWWCGAWQFVDPAATAIAAANNIGNSTTAPVEVPVVDLGFISTGREVALSAAGVNATATWTAGAGSIYTTGTAVNGGLAVASAQLAAGQLAVAPAAFDRGLAGTSRNESALVLILQPVQTPVRSLLTNGSFEAGGAGLATGWNTEATAPRLPTMSRSTTGVVDGAQSQRMQFTGTTGDTGMVSLYQSPITVNPGDVVTATVYLSGTLTNVYAIFGIEGFVTPGGAYISETDTTVNGTDLSATPRQFTVTYTCPGNCTAVAVYLQTPGLVPTSVVDVYLDKAIMTKA